MYTVGTDVEKTDKELIIRWEFNEIRISLDEIIEVTEDKTYAGKGANAIPIGRPFGTTDRIIIKGKKQIYILFTLNKNKILNEINSIPFS